MSAAGDRRIRYVAVYVERFGVIPSDVPEYRETEDDHA